MREKNFSILGANEGFSCPPKYIFTSKPSFAVSRRDISSRVSVWHFSSVRLSEGLAGNWPGSFHQYLLSLCWTGFAMPEEKLPGKHFISVGLKVSSIVYRKFFRIGALYGLRLAWERPLRNSLTPKWCFMQAIRRHFADKYSESRIQNSSLFEVMLKAYPISCKYSESRVETEKSRSIFIGLPRHTLY